MDDAAMNRTEKWVMLATPSGVDIARSMRGLCNIQCRRYWSPGEFDTLVVE